MKKRNDNVKYYKYINPKKTEIVTVKFEILALNFSCATYTLILNYLKMQTNSFTIICQLYTVTNACIQLLNV